MMKALIRGGSSIFFKPVVLNDDISTFLRCFSTSNLPNPDEIPRPAAVGQSRGRNYLNKLVEHLQINPKDKVAVSWKEILENCKRLDRQFNEINFGGILFGLFLKYNTFDLAQEYFKNEKNPSISILSNYIQLCAEAEDINENYIFEIYERIRAKNRGIWDQETSKRVIEAISKTSRWKECLEIVENLKIGGNLILLNIEPIAEAAFVNSEFELGWKILDEYKCKALERAYVAFLKHCQPKNEQNIIKVLNHLDINEIFPSISLITAINEYFTKWLGFVARETQIDRKGICTNCKNKLTQTTLTNDEFKILSDRFQSQVLYGKDLFYNTTKEELNRYFSFIENNEPFDVVLDGLNIAFILKSHNLKNAANNILKAVESFQGSRLRVLVIGRNHMRRWKTMDEIFRMASVFLIRDESEDDPFILYAALKSGIGCKFISKDIMKSHSFKLADPKYVRLFQRWRLSSQLVPLFRPSSGKFYTIPFASLLPVSQNNNGNWHIPYSDEKITSPYDFPSKWICLKK